MGTSKDTENGSKKEKKKPVGGDGESWTVIIIVLSSSNKNGLFHVQAASQVIKLSAGESKQRDNLVIHNATTT